MSIRALALLLLVAGLFACSTAEDQVEQARQDLGLALASGDRRAALDALAELRENQPDTPAALLEYVGGLIQAGEAPQAVWVLEEALVRFPDRDELRLALGNAAMLTADPSRARKVLDAVGPDSEQRAAALVLRARAELQLGDLEQALATFLEAEAADPDAPQLRLPRIGALLQERRFDEARAALEAARESFAADDTPLRRLQVSLFAFEGSQADADPEPAIRGLRAMVGERPDDLHAWGALVQLLSKQGRVAEARDLLAAAVAEEPGRVGLLGTLATLHNALGEPAKAEETLRSLVEATGLPSAHFALAGYLTSRGQLDEALAVYTEALESHPDSALLLHARAELLIDAKRPSEAREAIERFRRVSPSDLPVTYLRSRLTLAEGQPERAVASFRLLVSELDDASTQYWLGRALEANGDLEGAARRYGMAMGRSQTGTAPVIASINLARRRGDWPAVRAHARLLVQRAPGSVAGWNAFVVALLNLRELERADAISASALLASGQSAELRRLRAVVLRELGREDEALSLLAEARALGLDPGEVAAERALTKARGDLQAGLAEAREGLKQRPRSARLHQTLGDLSFRAGEGEAGVAAMTRALELDPSERSPLRQRAEYLASVGRFEEALRDADAYLAHQPDDAGVHYVRGASLDALGRADDAISAYRRAAALDASAYAPRNNLAEILAARGDVDGALEAAQEAFALAGDDPYVMDTLGWLYLRKGLVERSISILEDAHAAAPGLPEAQLHLALAYRDAGRKENARSLLDDLRPRTAERPELRAQVDAALASL